MDRRLAAGDTAFGVALAFVAGVFCESMDWAPSLILVGALAAGAAVAARKHSRWPECALIFLALASGIFYFRWHENRLGAGVNLPYGSSSSFTAAVVDEPRPVENFLVVPALAEAPYAGALTIFVPPGADIRYGDELRIEGKIRAPEDGGGAATIFPKKTIIAARNRGFWLREKLIDLKREILAGYRRVLARDEAALLGGIAFGSKVDFGAELKAAMAGSGTTHLVAVSGYNITIVIFAVGSTLGRFLSKRATFYAATVFLVLFMIMVGNAASGVRAALMGFLALIARQAGRRFNMRNAITLTAAGMAFADPAAPSGDMSFILSFLSLLGIVYLNPVITRVFSIEDGGLLGWKENAVTTVSAQIAVLPVVIRAFGRFSLSAIGANILILSTVPLTMFFGCILALAGFLSSAFAFFAGRFVGFILSYQIDIMRWGAAVHVPLPIPFGETFVVALYYSALVLAAAVLRSRAP